MNIAIGRQDALTVEQQEAIINRRQSYFEHEHLRLEIKLRDLVIQLLEQADEKCIEKLQAEEFNDTFKEAINTIPFQQNVEQEMLSNEAIRRELIVKTLDLYRLYLQLEFEKHTLKILEPVVKDLALTAADKIGKYFCDDVYMSSDEQNGFLEHLNNEVSEHMLKYYQNGLINMLKMIRPYLRNFSKVFLNRYFIEVPAIFSSVFDTLRDRDHHALKEIDRWEMFRGKCAEQFCETLSKLKKLGLVEKYQQDQSESPTLIEDLMNILQRIYAGNIEQMMNDTNHSSNANQISDQCKCRQAMMKSLRIVLNEMLASYQFYWSLSVGMMHQKQGANSLPDDEFAHVFKAELKYTEDSEPITVYVRSLVGDFDALHIRNQTVSPDRFNHPGVLYCYGAYCDGGSIYIVTEPWEKSLRVASDQGTGLSLDRALQIAMELTQICLQNLSLISANHLTPENILLTQGGHIKVNILACHLPRLDNWNDNSDKLRKEMSISRKLGQLFTYIFKDDPNHRPVVQALHSLANRCHNQVQNFQHQPPLLKEILADLELEQVSRITD